MWKGGVVGIEGDGGGRKEGMMVMTALDGGSGSAREVDSGDQLGGRGDRFGDMITEDNGNGDNRGGAQGTVTEYHWWWQE